MLRRLPPRKNKVKNPSRREKKLKLIEDICSKYPKIDKKIKNIEDLYKKLYYAKVWYITESQPLHILEGFEQRSYKGYHLDHIIPISYGFKNKISPEKMGNIKNLQFIPWEENFKKGAKVDESRVREILN